VEAALERTAAYATTRHQFGRPIGSFQAVSARLADGMIDVDAVRLSALRAAYELDACSGQPGPAADAAVAAAHFWACDAGHRLAHTAVHVHGGVGLDRSEPLHRYFLAAKAGEFRLGGATRQLLDLGEVLAGPGDPWEARAWPPPCAPSPTTPPARSPPSPRPSTPCAGSATAASTTATSSRPGPRPSRRRPRASPRCGNCWPRRRPLPASRNRRTSGSCSPAAPS